VERVKKTTLWQYQHGQQRQYLKVTMALPTLVTPARSEWGDLDGGEGRGGEGSGRERVCAQRLRRRDTSSGCTMEGTQTVNKQRRVLGQGSNRKRCLLAVVDAAAAACAVTVKLPRPCV
jgi:hypothetical protein